MTASELKLNDSKTVVLQIRSPYSQPLPPILSGLRVGQSQVFPSSTAKNLGVVFDDSLALDNHIEHMCKSCFLQLRYLSKIRDFIPRTHLETLVHAFITSRLDYSNGLLTGLPAYQLQRLQHVQNVAARLIMSANWSTPSSELLYNLHWLPIAERIRFKILLTTYRCVNHHAPAYLQELVTPYRPGRALRSADQHLLAVPRSKTVRYGKRAFSFIAPIEWNALPCDMRSITSLSKFKSSLKTYLFRSVYD